MSSAAETPPDLNSAFNRFWEKECAIHRLQVLRNIERIFVRHRDAYTQDDHLLYHGLRHMALGSLTSEVCGESCHGYQPQCAASQN